MNSATADAWSPQDKEAIQAKILAGCGFEEINEHVRQVMIAWIGNVVIGAMQRVVKGEDVLASAQMGKYQLVHIRAPRFCRGFRYFAACSIFALSPQKTKPLKHS